MNRLTRWTALAAVAAVLIVSGACSSGGGASSGPEGTYVHPEEGTITLLAGGKGTWEQAGNDKPFEFEWQKNGSTITLSEKGKKAGDARIENGNLVMPPELISGDKDVTFTRK